MSLSMKYAMKKRAKMAKGGMVEEEKASGTEPLPMVKEKDNEGANMEDADMIARIMHKRKMYSEGGMVANDDEPIADEMPAQFDDLALRDGLEEHETGANSGDKLGDAAVDEEDKDIVSKIMKSRAKKDRNPRPA